jgi:hypothetical protein
MQNTNWGYHEWELTVIVVAGLACVALTMLAEIVDKARVVYIKLRNFNKPDEPPKLNAPSP